jgi:hypothetical protein
MRLFILSLLTILSLTLQGQNLVVNAGFEDKSGCPVRAGQIYLANEWFSPNNGSPDYFNDCSPSLEFGTEFNKRGGRLPHSGHGYAGLQFYNLNRNEYYEYLETKLDTALTAGLYYCIRAWVSLGNVSYAVQELGAVLSVEELKTIQPVKLKIPHTILDNGHPLTDNEKWMCIRGIYKARGGEKYLTLGLFNERDDFWNIRTRSATDSIIKSSYYFIDDLSVEEVPSETSCSCPGASR